MAKNREMKKPKKERPNPAGSLPILENAAELTTPKKKKNTY